MMSCSRSCICGHSTNVEESTWYGVDPYPNLFYSECVGSNLSDNPEGPLVQYTYQPWPSLCWKVTVSVASLLLLLGVAALTTGYAVPPKLELVNDSKFSSMDDPVADYNQALITCRVAGATLCAVAGVLLAVCLFLATSGWLTQDIKAEPLVTEADSPVEVFRDEPEQLSPGFQDASSQSWFLTPTSPFGPRSVQTSQPQRDS
ncbi:neurensin-2 [Peromyscus maniculatus bairdii]|nr:neurensin-2 [Peromyscus maniculatus bairdii]XP_028743298.1 neurensin-2 [Peromyscus leucopus]